MELIEFNPDNCLAATGATKAPSISLNPKSGKLAFNLSATEKIGLKDGSMVKFYKDQKDPECWYLEVVKEGGFKITQVDRGKYQTTDFRNKKLATEISESVSFTGKSGKILIAGQPTKLEKRTLWGLIVTTLNNK